MSGDFTGTYEKVEGKTSWTTTGTHEINHLQAYDAWVVQDSFGSIYLATASYRGKNVCPEDQGITWYYRNGYSWEVSQINLKCKMDTELSIGILQFPVLI